MFGLDIASDVVALVAGALVALITGWFARRRNLDSTVTDRLHIIMDDRKSEITRLRAVVVEGNEDIREKNLKIRRMQDYINENVDNPRNFLTED